MVLFHIRIQQNLFSLQKKRLFIAKYPCDLSGSGHLKSVCMSHNALGSTGFELVLKTLPLHCLTHLDLSAVRRGPADYPALEHLTKILSQVHTHKSCPTVPLITVQTN